MPDLHRRHARSARARTWCRCSASASRSTPTPRPRRTRRIARFAEVCPDFPDRVVDRLALGPRELEERFGITGGHIFHGEMLPGPAARGPSRPAALRRGRGPLPGGLGRAPGRRGERRPRAAGRAGGARGPGGRGVGVARCFVTRELPGPALDRLRAEHEVEVWPERLPPRRGELRAAAVGPRACSRMLTDRVDAELIGASPTCGRSPTTRWASTTWTSRRPPPRGIPVGNTPDVLTESTADLTLALMLAADAAACARARSEVRAGEWLTWEPARLLGRDLHRSTVLWWSAPAGSERRSPAGCEGFGARVITAGRDDRARPLLRRGRRGDAAPPAHRRDARADRRRRAGGDEARRPTW